MYSGSMAKPRKPKICATCGEEFFAAPDRNRAKYCENPQCDPKTRERLCAFEGCENTFVRTNHSQGIHCPEHWYSGRKTLKPINCKYCNGIVQPTQKSQQYCNTPCSTDAMRRGTAPTSGKVDYYNVNPPKICQNETCETPGRMYWSRDPDSQFCKTACYNKSRAGKPKGGKEPLREVAGYIHLHFPTHPDVQSNGYIPIHRVIMQGLLGRRLLKDENVHHVNTIKDDNRVDGPLDERMKSGNLELWNVSQPPGARAIDKVEYALELIERYSEFLSFDMKNKLQQILKENDDQF